jgi:hypothetical protein
MNSGSIVDIIRAVLTDGLDMVLADHTFKYDLCWSQPNNEVQFKKYHTIINLCY